MSGCSLDVEIVKYKSLLQYLVKLVLEVGSEYRFADVLLYLVESPVASAVQLVCTRMYRLVVKSAKYIDKLFLYTALKYVRLYEDRAEPADAQLFGHFTMQSLSNSLAIVNVSAACRVPFVRLNVFPFRTLLQIKSFLPVEYMQMNYGVKLLRTIVCFAP